MRHLHITNLLNAHNFSQCFIQEVNCY